MKKFISILLLSVIIFSSFFCIKADDFVSGDVNNNGIVDINDCSLILEYVLNNNFLTDNENIVDKEHFLKAAKVSSNDSEIEISALDAALVLKKALSGGVFLFPIESTTESTTETTTESTTESTTETTTESTTESTTETTTESTTESTTETTTENTTESTTEATTQSTTDYAEIERLEKMDKMVVQLMNDNKPSWSGVTWNVEKKGQNKWHYANGCMIKAFFDLYEVTGKQEYYDFAKSHMDFFLNDDGEIIYYSSNSTSNSNYKYNPTKSTGYLLDDINSGKPLFYLYEKTGEQKYKNAIDLLETQLENQPKTKTNVAGNFWHKYTYPNQIWLDGLYMAQPFYMEYGSKYSDSKDECIDSYNQFMNVYNNLKDDSTGLYYHGYDDEKKQDWADEKTGLSQSFWLRAIGWYAMSLVDTIEKMPSDMEKEKNDLINIYKELADSMIKYQSENGMWYQVVDRPKDINNFEETSGTLAVGYSMMKASRLGYVDKSYFDYGKKAFDGVIDNYVSTNSDGKIELRQICLVAGLGNGRDGSYEYYTTQTTISENDAKGLGPLMFAYNEVLYSMKN